MATDTMGSSAFCKRYGISPRAARLYEEKRLLPPSTPRVKGSIRRYSEADGQRVQLIKILQQCGLTLQEISRHLPKNGSEIPAIPLPEEVIEQQIALLEMRLDEIGEGLKLLRGWRARGEGTN